MRRLLLLLLSLPVFTLAQEVKPILSKDYLELVNRDSLAWKRNIITDSTNSIRTSLFSRSKSYSGEYRIRKIVMKNDRVILRPAYTKRLMIGGTFSTQAAIKRVNRIPALQSDYVQGRSQGGMLQWRGPETGELFSYGPAAGDLEYDNSAYVYDVNGRLVPTGTGNGKRANIYNNDIIRTGSYFEQNLTLKGRYLVNGSRVLTAMVRLGKDHENMVINNNTNKSENLSVLLDALIKKLTLTANYSTIRDRFSNNNRYGFLNRVYQQSLLTPVSFDNAQGYTLAGGQRSYSAQGDNPWFLLKDNGNGFEQSHQVGSLSAEKKFGEFRYKLNQTLESLRQHGTEMYKPGTASFPNGMIVARKKNDANYQLNAEASWQHYFSPFYGKGGLIYFYNNNKTGIDYRPGEQYHYQRSSHDLSLYCNFYDESGSIDYGVNLVNKMYASNTSTKDYFFLPNVIAYLETRELFDGNSFRVKLSGTYNRFVSELPVNRSFSSLNLLQFSTGQSLQYFPVTEVAGFDGLQPVQHHEWTAMLEVDYKYNISFRGQYFIRNNRNDMFPVFRNGQLQLVNMADHRNQGVDLSLKLGPKLWRTGKLMITHDISFFKYNNTVRQVRDGYDYTPIAGFSNVHKAIIKGKALGSTVGSGYLRDANNNIMIGNDGFPLVDPNPVVIGNPIPDFVLKLANTFNYKNFFASLDVEWKKGGDVWNGTQAVLDYYGRSANSGMQRTITDYVFPGVLPNNHVNDIPVKFYDPSQPLENNRWVRYGHTGVAEAYIQRGDYIRLNNINIGYKFTFRKYLQTLSITGYIGNIILWTPYKGGDPSQLLYDQPQTDGLDFFNLPSLTTMGLNVSVQF